MVHILRLNAVNILIHHYRENVRLLLILGILGFCRLFFYTTCLFRPAISYQNHPPICKQYLSLLGCSFYIPVFLKRDGIFTTHLMRNIPGLPIA